MRRGATRRRGPALVRLLVVVLTALLLGLVGAAPASAHNRFVASDPADGATLAQTPSTVVLTFDEPAVALGTQVVVTGPDGVVGRGDPRLVDATVHQELAGGAPAGQYTVEWRVASDDGHPIEGRLSFTSEVAGPPRSDLPDGVLVTPTGQPSTAWPWVILAMVLLAGAGAVSVIVRRRRRPIR